MRVSLLVASAIFLASCSNEQSATSNYGPQASTGIISGSENMMANGAYGALGSPQPKQSLRSCVYAKKARARGVPSLASHILRKASQASGAVEIGLDDVLTYTGYVLNASGGDGISAAEVISTHEAADSACMREQIAYWQQNAQDADGSKHVKMLTQANGALGQAYSMLKTYTAVGDAADLSERLSRSYIPVRMTIPSAVL